MLRSRRLDEAGHPLAIAPAAGDEGLTHDCFLGSCRTYHSPEVPNLDNGWANSNGELTMQWQCEPHEVGLQLEPHRHGRDLRASDHHADRRRLTSWHPVGIGESALAQARSHHATNRGSDHGPLARSWVLVITFAGLAHLSDRDRQ